MKNIIVILCCLVLGFSACTDKAKDPLLFHEVKSGNIIALRGKAVDNLNTRAYVGAIDSFSASKPANEKFEFDAEFLSNTPDNLSKIEVYAKKTEKSARAKVATIEGSTFTVPSGGINPRGSVSIPLTTILTAIKATATEFGRGDYIYIECDLLLKDGSTVNSSSVVNSSLFESSIFYPAHSLLYLVGQ